MLIGYDGWGKCVYSELLDIHDYYDGDHLWDDASRVKKLQLQRLTGYLFSPTGILDQEFESLFDPKTGAYKSRRILFADGTSSVDP